MTVLRLRTSEHLWTIILNERGMKMKRFVCALLVLCLIPVCAFCVDLDEFNMYASIFGEEELDADSGQTQDSRTFYRPGDCIVAFNEKGSSVNSIMVNGDGIPFLAYSMAAIMYFDPSSENYSANAGQFFSTFLLCRNKSEESYGSLVNGEYIVVEKIDKGYMFIVGK